jgi:prepilin-type N-terminal cleavage/methylation domain-containing protein
VRERQQGFTLIEVIVSLTILAMTILLVSRAFLTLLQVTNQGGNQTVATSLAVRKLEEVRSAVESQNDTSTWTTAFCNLQSTLSPTSFGAPYDNYFFEVVVNQVSLSAWSAEPGAAYAQPGTCGAPEPGNHPNNMKWVTVRVTFRGQQLAQVSSAVIRDMYR